MKSFFLFSVLMFGTVAAFATGESMMKFIPAQCNGIIVVDVKGILTNPTVKEFRQLHPEADWRWGQVEAELKRYQLNPQDLFQTVAVFSTGKDDGGFLVETVVNETAFSALLANDFGQTAEVQLNVKSEKIGDRTVYSLNSSSNNETLQKLQSQDVIFTYIDQSHVLFIPRKQLPDTLAQLPKSNLANNTEFQQKLKKVNTNAAIWLIADIPQEFKQSDPNQPQNPMYAALANISSVAMSVDLAGKDKSIALNGNLNCKDAPAAAMMAQQLQMITMMFIGAGLANEQQLATDVNGAIKIIPAGNDVKLNVIISEKLQKQLKQFAAKQSGMSEVSEEAPAAAEPASTTDSSDSAAPDPRQPDANAARDMLKTPEDDANAQPKELPRNVLID